MRLCVRLHGGAEKAAESNQSLRGTIMPAKMGPEKRQQKNRKPIYIVGIGSSAGGLEALKEFFEHMPGDSGMAFILIPHLDPNTKSIMYDLLPKSADLPQQ